MLPFYHHLIRRVYLCSPLSAHRRSLFSLPDLSSFTAQPPTKYHERKIFPYKPRQLYDVVAEVSSYPRFIPFCTGARTLGHTEPDTNGRSVIDHELTVGFMNLTESYVSKVTCTPHESVEAVAATSTPLFKTLTSTWRFQPVPGAKLPDGGPTLVTLDLEFAFTSPLHAAVSSAFFGQVSKQMVGAFEERCIDVYGLGTEK